MGKKILVIDDDVYLKELYVEVLTTEGYDVDAAENGEEGLQNLGQGGYDLVLLNMIMPKLDGLGVLKAIAKHPPQVKNGPVVILTNLSHDPLIAEAAEAGARAYLIKAELTPAQIVDYVRKILESEFQQHDKEDKLN